jgi:hypothetical protein
MKKVFHFEFDDESAGATGKLHDGISYECSETERLSTTTINDAPAIFANPDGLLTLAKILVKMGMSNYKSGFHLHLQKDFSSDPPDVLTISVGNTTDRESDQT